MTEPTSRYRKAKERRESVGRHYEITGQLGSNVRQEFDRYMEEATEPTPCIVGGVPSRWTDWDSNPDNREPYETDMPAGNRAREMCKPCPLMGTGICIGAALARGETHGVWEGVRISEGKVLD